MGFFCIPPLGSGAVYPSRALPTLTKHSLALNPVGMCSPVK